jgi:hypothetical protein
MLLILEHPEIQDLLGLLVLLDLKVLEEMLQILEQQAIPVLLGEQGLLVLLDELEQPVLLDELVPQEQPVLQVR